MKSYLYKGATGAGAVIGSTPGVIAANDSLTGTITALLPTIIEFILVIILLKVVVETFRGFKV